MTARQQVKRRIFISFDHDDRAQVNGFLGLRNLMDNFDFYNHKLDRRVQSTNEDYVKRVIREEYISPASVTVVLAGGSSTSLRVGLNGHFAIGSTFASFSDRSTVSLTPTPHGSTLAICGHF